MNTPIPVLTLEDTEECSRALLTAARDYGFVYIHLENSPITPSDVDRCFRISHKLFKETPIEDREACIITANNKGWSGIGSEVLDPATQKRGDFKQAFNIGEFDHATNEPQQPLPPALDTEKEYLAKFSTLCRTLCHLLLSHFARALGLDRPYFLPSHTPANGPSGSILRLLYYPSVPSDYGSDSTDMRAGAHSDYGSITLLFQRPGQPGLEILMPQSLGGGWKMVPIVENAVCVNIGDLLSHWTAGLLRSTVHRVVGSKGGDMGGERFSVAYFCHPVNETRLEPIESRLVKERGGRGANEGVVMTAREHLEGRLAATYGWKK